ncbi:F-box protein At5g49610-like [Asparagus officinalis]|uniref:F-box protein At5g49610-like n=1 Tax=Asparagus officinalis TaxID=4686 RepID=UPI00098E65A1|nr:F-box protein At5g49610-like [Asparagus officinalis]
MDDDELAATMKTKKQKGEPSSPASTPVIAGCMIPEELILCEILLRLPYKLLCRFKCVCKKWNNFKFLPNYQLVSVGKDDTLVYTITTSGITVCKSYPNSFFPNDDYRARLINSTNGLLCLELENNTINHRFLYVHNPLTSEGRVIPDSSDRVNSVALAFESKTSSTDYKIIHPVKLRYDRESSARRRHILTFGFEIFSSITSKWVSTNAKVTIRDFIKLGKSIYVKGVVYWECSNQLMSFNIKEDVCTIITLPEKVAGLNFIEMGVCKDQLTYTKICGFYLQVWLLNNNGNWEQIYKVNIRQMVVDNEHFFLPLGLLLMRKNKEVECLLYEKKLLPLPFYGGDQMLYMRVRVSHSEQTVISYNFKTRDVSRDIEDRCAGRILPYNT